MTEEAMPQLYLQKQNKPVFFLRKAISQFFSKPKLEYAPIAYIDYDLPLRIQDNKRTLDLKKDQLYEVMEFAKQEREHWRREHEKDLELDDFWSPILNIMNENGNSIL